MTPAAVSEDALQREWWLRVAMVLMSPRAVFRALAGDSEEAADARQEPIVALVFLAGIAAVLSFSAASRTFLDDPSIDGVLVAVIAFLGGGLYGFAGYWLGGIALHLGTRGAQGEGGYRQARHLLAYAMAPLALSLAVWPVRLAAYGGDNFRTGGSDEGAGYWAFTAIAFAFLAWSLGLLLVGVRELHGWTVVRSLGALVLAVFALAGLAVVGVLLGGL